MSLVPCADMHCHLGFCESEARGASRCVQACSSREAAVWEREAALPPCETAASVARFAQQAGMWLFSNTITPAEYARCHAELRSHANVIVGFGLHPWWVRASENPNALLEKLEECAPRALGEVGLDFGTRHVHTRSAQIAAFTAIAQWAARTGDHLLSIHAVKAAGEVLDILQHTGALRNNTCIFHWFSGTQPELNCALAAGCYISVGARMLATKKGRAYVAAVPVERLLLETDEPQLQSSHQYELKLERHLEGNLEGENISDARCVFEHLQASLVRAADALCALKGSACIEVINATSLQLLRDAS